MSNVEELTKSEYGKRIHTSQELVIFIIGIFSTCGFLFGFFAGSLIILSICFIMFFVCIMSLLIGPMFTDEHTYKEVFLKLPSGGIWRSPAGKKPLLKKRKLEHTQLAELPSEREDTICYIISDNADRESSNKRGQRDITVTPEEFEEYVAEVYRDMGFRAKVTKQSGDRGIDVIAHKNGHKIIIQAKRNSKGNKVSRPTVQKTLAAGLSENADKVAIVTTSSFTEPAISESEELSSEIPVELHTV